MKIQNEHRDINTTLTGETKRFRINANAKAFRVLVDGLYSDKIQSVIRELMSNADDAHRRRGNTDVPFEVRLPNPLNPTFSVRDFGCSMTHEMVMGTYSELFGSDKSDSDDETGAFGLGAKAFLALTDACTVRCWLDGEVRTYLIALDEDCIPAVTLVNAQSSEAPQGVEVTFAANPDDFDDYNTALNLVGLAYDVPPRVLGAEMALPVPTHIGNGWRLYCGGLSSHFVRQGSAVYPVPQLWSEALPPSYRIILDVPIGTVGVVASREALSATHEQMTTLKTLFAVAVEEVRDLARNEYTALATPIEKALYAHEHATLLGDHRKYPASMDLDFPVFMWGMNADQSAVRHFTVDAIRRAIMVLDDEPIIRKKIRLKALGNGNRTVYIVSDEAKWKAVRNAMRLSNEQMERMSAIPDILPKPRTGGGGGGGSIKKDIHLNRVWAIAQGGYLNVMPGQFSGYTWSTTSRPTRRYTHSSLFGMGNDTLVLNSLRSVVPNMVGGVLYVTPLQAERGLKKGTLDPALRLDLVMGRFIATLGDKIEQQIKFNNLPGNSMKNIVFAERYGLSSPNVHSTFVNMYSREFPDKVKQFNADAAKLAAEIIDRYPLLFADSKDAILRYVEMIDAEETA